MLPLKLLVHMEYKKSIVLVAVVCNIDSEYKMINVVNC